MKDVAQIERFFNLSMILVLQCQGLAISGLSLPGENNRTGKSLNIRPRVSFAYNNRSI